VRAELAKAQASLKEAGRQTSLGDQALEHLKRYGYKIDGQDGQIAATLTSMGLSHLIDVEKKDGGY